MKHKVKIGDLVKEIMTDKIGIVVKINSKNTTELSVLLDKKIVIRYFDEIEKLNDFWLAGKNETKI